MRKIAKALLRAGSTCAVWPLAAFSGFGRVHAAYRLAAQALALIPGLPGSYLRVAYYALTLTGGVGPGCHIDFGSFFAHPTATIGEGVYVGAYCVIGCARLGARTKLASGVQILSGTGQHTRDSEGNLGDEGGRFVDISIGEHCWLGAGALVMADVGERSTVAAGSVVVKPVPDNAVVGGNPAKPLHRAKEASAG